MNVFTYPSPNPAASLADLFLVKVTHKSWDDSIHKVLKISSRGHF